MRITVLGSGTSMGVPTLGCDCPICLSPDPNNKRLRASILIELQNQSILVDCGPDFRTQAIRASIHDIHAVLLTHTHTDHIAGLDDLRPYNFLRGHSIPIFGKPNHLADLKTRFAYAFAPPQPGGGIPQLELISVQPYQPFHLPQIPHIPILPVEVLHGSQPILGFRIGAFAYLTDVSSVPPETRKALTGVEVLITSALRHDPHPTHMSLSQAVEFVRSLGSPQAFFTHMNHDLDHAETNAQLPRGMALLYDTQVFEVPDPC